jgi:exopolysaccharide biosynthesis polyprenyl glycosylphosphotransferase
MHPPTQIQTENIAELASEFVGQIRQNGEIPERAGTAARFRRIVAICEILADWLTIIVGARLGYLLYWSLAIGKHVQYPARLVWTAALAFASVMVLMLDRAGAYRSSNSLLRVRETEQILRVFAQALLAVFAASFLASVLFARWLLVLCLALIPLALFVQKNILYLLVRWLHARGYGNERVLIYGAGGTGRRVFSALRRSPKLGLVPVAVVDDDPRKAGGTLFELAYERRRGAKVISGPITADLIQSHAIDLIIIAIPSITNEPFTRAVEEALAAHAKVSFVPSQYLSPESWVDYRDLDGILLASSGQPVERFWYEAAKRSLDVIVSALSILIGTPLFLLLSLLIKLDSPGPVFFRQERVGRNGLRFCMFKFRTMRTDALAYDYSPKKSSDYRITRVGRFLRKTSLDELPQLFNVFLGDMSLVGPRPEMPFIVEQYSPLQGQRLRIKPGITGLWQLSGDRAFLIHENIEYDLYYIRHRNFFMDLAVLLHTSIFAMRGI